MTDPQGFWSLVLHAHLPYIRHPEHLDFLEEDWFYEALTETYIPILSFAERLLNEGVYFRFTINLSPTLCSMMRDELLMSRYKRHLEKMIELSEKETFRTRSLPFHATARMYEKKLKACREVLDRNHGRILEGFKNVQNAGAIEIITCCATHGYLPLMIDRRAQAAQIRVGADYYTETFGRRPQGIWLAECAYVRGVDDILKEQGIRYFFLDSHGLLFSEPRPRYGVFAPVICPSGVAAFARDHETATQVWSADQGYPGDSRYREFYRDLGYDLEYSYVKPYLHSDGIRRNMGLKYHRITGKVALDQKEPYNPDWAREAAAEHAGNFLFNREQQARYLNGVMGRKPVIVSMYDAELYGHWWYEGPDFLEYIFRKMHYDQKTVKAVTPAEYLQMFPNNQMVQPCDSSWGDKGYFEVWLNGDNDWIYRHIHIITGKMIALAERYKKPGKLEKRALNQLAREVLLAQGSDWAFLMTAGTAIHYSHKRTRDHVHRFLTLERELLGRNLNEGFLKECETKDNIFPNLDYKVFR
ncbi:MAG: glycoside hydrolase [Elusimicrobia bacterium RIFCSPLOWO2_01_FULL_64_13]|nr:MAG: glycoside hydrolase [Elusimicrobia bacterium RIFCSPHIGHO2_01_FULL_64_10]OGR96418.1 MAG: glycoside hydrolase [Elusimicrobia bacterium RIFCSPLOWO2_01_FULL_64_13]